MQELRHIAGEQPAILNLLFLESVEALLKPLAVINLRQNQSIALRLIPLRAPKCLKSIRVANGPRPSCDRVEETS